MSYVPSIAVVALDSLAETGGQSLNFIWWIAGILVLAGVVIAFAAAASKRKRAAAESAEPSEPASEDSTPDGDADPASEQESPDETK